MTVLVQERQRKQTETEKALDAERGPLRPAGPAGRQSEGPDRPRSSRKSPPRPGRQPRRGRKPADPKNSLAALNDPGRLVAGDCFRLGQGRAAAAAQRHPDSRVRRCRTASAEPKRASRSRAGPARRSRRPCDGWVVYAGPFRSYGQLLILNAGGGYHVLLAGMERISVDLGPVCADRRASGGDGGRAAIGRRRSDRFEPAGPVYRVSQGRDPRRSQPMVGGNRQRKGSRMIRKTSLVLLGAAAGVAVTLLATQPRLICSERARKRPPPTPTGSSTCSATCSSACAPTTSRSRMTPS